jgi:universal stress protein A
MNIKRILFPTDLLDSSAAALKFATSLAASNGAVMHVVYVNDISDLIAKSAHTCPSFVAVMDRSEIKARLEGIKPILANIPCECHFVEGEPAAEICAIAEKEHIDLIVMSSHGRTGLSRVLMGSVAEGVMRRAKCPVLIVKQPAKHAEHGDAIATKPAHA